MYGSRSKKKGVSANARDTGLPVELALFASLPSSRPCTSSVPAGQSLVINTSTTLFSPSFSKLAFMDVTSSSVVSPFRFAVDFPSALASSYDSTSNRPGTAATRIPPHKLYTRDSLKKYTFGAISITPRSFSPLPSFVALSLSFAYSNPRSPSASTKYVGTAHCFSPVTYASIVSLAFSPSYTRPATSTASNGPAFGFACATATRAHKASNDARASPAMMTRTGRGSSFDIFASAKRERDENVARESAGLIAIVRWRLLFSCRNLLEVSVIVGC
ncbi:hypothetical protein BE221DRAFT_78594 [Ostreococcus tauri]|uniref:Uncharacterized protein n=1 Tax=Ostreococcus tauri TaxID=70448 RepID=A0A1Y5IAE7_OSTTA|nr:hypothetical protein BE221DRAFT_78594 [Ostreococcus tauri]